MIQRRETKQIQKMLGREHEKFPVSTMKPIATKPCINEVIPTWRRKTLSPNIVWISSSVC